MSIITNTTPQAVFNKASKDKFLLVFEIPPAFKNWVTSYNINKRLIVPNSVQFSVFGLVVPEIEVPALTLPYAGQNLKVSSHARPAYEESTVGFTIDNRFKNYWTIWKWLDLLNDASKSGYDQNFQGNHQKDYILNYTANMSVLAMDEYNKPILEIVYTMAFPTRLGGIQYDYKDPEEVVSEFSFAYSQLKVTPVLTSI